MNDVLELVLILTVMFIFGFMFGRFLRWQDDERRVELKFKIQLAKMHFGDRWSERLAECDRSHIPGDCVLCGADSES